MPARIDNNNTGKVEDNRHWHERVQSTDTNLLASEVHGKTDQHQSWLERVKAADTPGIKSGRQ